MGKKLKNMTDTNLLLTITIVVFFVMYIGAIVFQGKGFLKPQTFFNILNANAALIILSCGMSLVMITGGIDISVGGVVALAVSGEYLSVPASVGFIALMGIAVLNGLVLVTCFNQLAARGLPITEVVRQGALRRLRPVLMTASITGLGLFPLLLATGPGSEIQRPLAIVVVGGLVSATALTLLLMPLLYYRFGQPDTPRAHDGIAPVEGATA